MTISLWIAPSITPLVKYFCRKGYTQMMGMHANTMALICTVMVGTYSSASASPVAFLMISRSTT